jgi:hypothetical protein
MYLYFDEIQEKKKRVNYLITSHQADLERCSLALQLFDLKLWYYVHPDISLDGT